MNFGFDKRLVLGGMVAASAMLAACGEDKGQVAATVNGEAIYENDINSRMAQLPANLVQGREADIRRQLAESLVQQSLMEQEADKLNVTSEKEFKDAMAQAEEQLKARFVMKKKVDAAVTDEAIAAAYEANKSKMAFPAVKARHILVATQTEAQDLIKVANKSNFAQLATEKSVGPSKEQGGDLGWFRKEAMIPQFADVAFRTPVGQVAQQPVQTQFGWHVVLVEDKNDNFIPPLDAVKEQIRQQLGQEVVAGVISEMRQQAKVEYKDAALAPVADANAPAAGQPAQQ